MFEILVFILITSFYSAIVLWSIMFLYRAGIAIQLKGSIKEKLFIIFLPCGYGVFAYVKNQKQTRIYRILIMILFVLSLLASLFLFHRELGL